MEALTDSIAARIANLLVPVGEERLEDLAAGNDGMPAHPGHPALQPLHAHLYELLLKSAYRGTRAGFPDCKFLLCAFLYQVHQQRRRRTCHLLVRQRGDGDGRAKLVQQPLVQPVKVLVSVVHRAVCSLQCGVRGLAEVVSCS